MTTDILVMTRDWKPGLQLIKSFGTTDGATGLTSAVCYNNSSMTLYTGEEVPLVAPCVVTAEPKNARTHYCARFLDVFTLLKVAVPCFVGKQKSHYSGSYDSVMKFTLSPQCLGNLFKFK